MLFNVQLLCLQRLHWPAIVKRVSYAIHFNGLIWTILVMAFLSIPTKSWGKTLKLLQTGKTFIVNSPGDEEDSNAGEPGDDNMCDVDPGTPGEQCTFRAAIQNHNANCLVDCTVRNQIIFDIDLEQLGALTPTIEVGSTGNGALPFVLGIVTIDGTTQLDPTGNPVMIELDGSQAGTFASGLELRAGGGDSHAPGEGSIIRGLVIHSFASHGIAIGGTGTPGLGGHVIEGCFIGTDLKGIVAQGNGGNGIYIEDTPNNTIGGETSEQCTIISGNTGDGIRIESTFLFTEENLTTGNKVLGNFIGTDLEGNTALSNGSAGVHVIDAVNTTIGASNLISGNAGAGVHIEGAGAMDNIIMGNLIGSNFDKTVFLGNTNGVLLEDAIETTVSDNTVVSSDIETVGPAIEIRGGTKITVNQNSIRIEQSSPAAVARSIKAVQFASALRFNQDRKKVAISAAQAGEVEVTANNIGGSSTDVKFKGGITLDDVEEVRAELNTLTRIDGLAIEAFTRVASKYSWIENKSENQTKGGAKFTFESFGLPTSLSLEGNVTDVDGDGEPLLIDHFGGNLALTMKNNDNNGEQGSTINLFSDATVNQLDDTWKSKVGGSLKYFSKLDEGEKVTIRSEGQTTFSETENGVEWIVELGIAAEYTHELFKLNSSGNGKNGAACEFFIGLGAKAKVIADSITVNGNARAGFAVTNSLESREVLFFEWSRGEAKDNVEAAIDLVGAGKIIFEILGSGNSINDNGTAGVRVGGSSEGNIVDNTFSGNGIGILVEDMARVTINNNTLTGNGHAVVLAGAGTGSSILGNSIFGSLGLGIDLGNDGVTPNDPGDADAGPNNFQNFPVLSAVTSNGGNTHIQGSLNSTPNTTFRLDFFSNNLCDPSGFGEGETFLGFGQVTTDGTGNADFSVNLNGITVPDGAFITATATDSANNTSEFSGCLLFGTAQLADLELTKESDKTLLTVGEQVTFTIKLTNKGPDEATSIAVKDVAPAGMTFDQITESVGNYDETTGIWTINNLGSGGEAVLTITGTVLQEGIITNTAEVTASDQTDPDSTPNNGDESEDDQSSVTVEVQETVSVEQQLLQLIAQVENLINEGELSKQQGKVLTVLLEVTIKLHRKDNTQATISTLRVFNLLVKILIHRGQLSKVAGQELILAAENIINQLKMEALVAKNNSEKVNPIPNNEIDESINVRLHPVYPNPFTTSTMITFELVEERAVHLMIYDEQGMKTVYEFRELMPAGVHTLSWAPEHLPAGMYILHLQAGSSTATSRMLFVK